jgi:hypothetical protein
MVLLGVAGRGRREVRDGSRGFFLHVIGRGCKVYKKDCSILYHTTTLQLGMLRWLS